MRATEQKNGREFVLQEGVVAGGRVVEKEGKRRGAEEAEARGRRDEGEGDQGERTRPPGSQKGRDGRNWTRGKRRVCVLEHRARSEKHRPRVCGIRIAHSNRRPPRPGNRP